MIGIIDYGMGNLGSFLNMFKKLGKEINIITSPKELKKISKIILPGVGAFDNGIIKLRELGFITELENKVLFEKIPFLGVCLGMQLITKGSEEGTNPGLGWIDGYTYKFKFQDSKFKVPHMGWNNVNFIKENPLIDHNLKDQRFYFVHSYYVNDIDEKFILGKTNYSQDFISAIQRNNIYAVQFHPEKSHKYGMQILNGFIKL